MGFGGCPGHEYDLYPTYNLKEAIITIFVSTMECL